MLRFELIRDWETPLTKFYKGHFNTAGVWANVFGISEIEFYQYLADGRFRDWLKPLEENHNTSI